MVDMKMRHGHRIGHMVPVIPYVIKRKQTLLSTSKLLLDQLETIPRFNILETTPKLHSISFITKFICSTTLNNLTRTILLRLKSSTSSSRWPHGKLHQVFTRASSIRPTRGYAFLLSSQVGGLAPESKSARFVRQVCRNPYVRIPYFVFLGNHLINTCKMQTLLHIFSF